MGFKSRQHPLHLARHGGAWRGAAVSIKLCRALPESTPLEFLGRGGTAMIRLALCDDCGCLPIIRPYMIGSGVISGKLLFSMLINEVCPDEWVDEFLPNKAGLRLSSVSPASCGER